MGQESIKRILEIEKKYSYKINSIEKRFEENKEKFLKEIDLKYEVMREDYIKEKERELEKLKKDCNYEAQKIIASAKEEANHIKETANFDQVFKFILEDIKNV
jgi:vacuolar-type H+-ATPase subunit H